MPDPLDYETPKPPDEADRAYAVAPVAGCFGAVAAIFAGFVLLGDCLRTIAMLRDGRWRADDAFPLIIVNLIGLTAAYFAFRWIGDAVRAGRAEDRE